MEAQGCEERYLLGFEESYGYLSGGYVRDKDAVDGSMLICEMAVSYTHLAGAENGMGKSLLDRLRLTETRIQDMAKAVIEVAEAPDPIGRVLSGESRPNGLRIEKVTVPLGVIGIIYAVSYTHLDVYKRQGETFSTT